MIRAVFIILCTFFVLVINGQDVEGIVEFNFEMSTDSDRIKVLDANETNTLVLVSSNSFTTNNGFEFQDEESNGVLLFCDISLNVLWYVSFDELVLNDAVLGQNGIYVFGEGSGILQLPNGSYEVQQSTFVGSLGSSGEELWFREYSGLRRLWSPERSLSVDLEENLFLSTGLWNYDHPASNDTLVFQSDTCNCSAVSLDFPLCATTLKWDSEGNEQMYHILESQGYSYVNDVGLDSNGNFYVCGSLDHSIELPVFAGEAIDGGEFVLKFGENNEEEWFYSRSNQELGYNSSTMSFIDADESGLYLDVLHNTNEVVTGGQTVILEQPIEGIFHFRTIHEVDIEQGSLSEVHLFGHMVPLAPLERTNGGDIYAVANLITGFIHDFPPFTFNPESGELPILVKTLQGDYKPFIVFDPIAVSTIDNISFEKLYLDLSNDDGNVVFGLNDTPYETSTSNCVVIVDRLTDINESDEYSNSVIVHPNPFNETIYIQGVNLYEAVNYEILSVNGTMVQTGVSTGTMDLGSLSRGLYILRIEVEGEWLSLKIIKN